MPTPSPDNVGQLVDGVQVIKWSLIYALGAQDLVSNDHSATGRFLISGALANWMGIRNLYYLVALSLILIAKATDIRG